MNEIQTASTQLKDHYAAQVTADLERNALEQEHIGVELAALQEQLRALQNDRELLEKVREALGGAAPEAPDASATSAASEADTRAGTTPAATVPVPRRAAAEPKPAQRKKADAGAGARKAKKPAADAADHKAAAASAQPTLGELIRIHLAAQPEPRSTAEVTSALSHAHPDRAVKATVVRTTIEGLVAKGRVERTKQGSSVFYTAVAAPDHPTAASTHADEDAAG